MKIAMVMVKFSVFNIYVVGIVGVLLFILVVEGTVLGIKKLVENRELKKQQAQADDIRKEKKRQKRSRPYL